MEFKATALGSTAIIMWSLLALFTASTQGIPPFQLLFLTFGVGGTIGFLIIILKGGNLVRIFNIPLKAWFICVGGLFGYHFFYFTALSNSPVADASLIAYLWPLLIVLFSSFLPGENLRWFHILGGIFALFGAVILIVGKGEISLSSQYIFGYLMALMSALIWAIYSILNRTLSGVSTDAVAGFCIVTAILGAFSHMILEQWVMPSNDQWLAIFGLGIGPVGAAFYVWDYGTKHGNIKLLGVLSYGAPLLSTIILTLSGKAELTWALAVACLFITGGALIASLDLFKARLKHK